MSSVRGSREIVLYLARRFLWGVSVIWLVLSVTWFLVQLKPERTGGLGGPGTQPVGFQLSLISEYFSWIGDYLTLQWGEGVIHAWLTAGPVTLAYLLPALVFAALIGVGLATYGAMRPGGWVDRFVSALSYTGVSVPTFVLAEGVLVIGVERLGIYTIYRADEPLLALENVIGLGVPATLMMVSLVGIIARYARNESLSHLNKEFVKTARAKGATRLRIAAHVFRNAWLALAQVMFSETVGLIFLGTIVLEVALAIPGMGARLFAAFQAPNGPLIISAVLVAVFVGVLGTWIQDLGRVFLFPEETD